MHVTKLKSSRPIEALSTQRVFRLHPVCHAIAMLLAAGAATNAHAGLVNLANVGAQITAARATGGAGLANLG
ncbi:MAG TPA: hypothetical protein VGG24_00185, partial [Paraburkholderia sp.]